ncbi:MAG: hypothetical protein J6T03_03035 [Bacteroidales bacterium]|nr:hypothetical protein [Bacteroidales bacterium]
MSKVWSAFLPIAVLTVVCLLFYLMLKPAKSKEKEFDKLFGNVYFEGNVLSAPVYNNSTLLCIKIDTASVDSFYYFNRGDWALCIHDGMAVMPIGMIDKYDSVGLFKATSLRVVVNKDHNKKAIFIRDNDTLQQDLDFWPAKLEEVHLLMACEDVQTL